MDSFIFSSYKKPGFHLTFTAHLDDATLLEFETVREQFMGRGCDLNLSRLAGRFHA